MYVTTVQVISRQLYISVPKALARELGLVRRMYVRLDHGPSDTIIVRKLPEALRDGAGRAARPA